MVYNIILSENALHDLMDIYDYILRNDSLESAEYVVSHIEKNFNSLSQSPNRGSYPKELLATGVKEFREIYFKPYRIIYEVVEDNINILIIVDGRRDIRALLSDRILI